ncbi:type II toxin-antitoxin system RelE/ParE family toxin [Candidatus Acetothermia bacterium]|nr:type II toxin-antitoxin system RelE/ParE family toxin [Candidatus Acetothermia bacterium]
MKNSPQNTSYNVTLIPAAQDDFDNLDGSIRQLAYSQFKKLKENPQLGDTCGKKYGLDLTGFRKLHFANNAFRIVYKIIESEKKVQIWGIGKRESEKIYRMVATRLSDIRLQLQGKTIKMSGKAHLKKRK